MNVLVVGTFHEKNTKGLYKILNYLKYTFDHTNDCTDFTKYDVIISPSKPLEAHKWPTKKFIFGPHFGIYPSVFPSIHAINNSETNCVYVQPSDWVTALFYPHVINMPVKTLSFPIDTDLFKQSRVNPIETKKVMLYFKSRNPSCLSAAHTFLVKHGYEPVVFDYKKRYLENDYVNALQSVAFVFWVGCHESQGFAVQEALAMNVPLFVWNAKLLSDEWGSGRPDIRATSLSYWDDSCGSFFYDAKDMDAVFERFIVNYTKGAYQPHAFIHSQVGLEACAQRFLKLVDM